MKYWVYILESLSDGSHYIGSTADPGKRLSEHNAGRCRYTKGHRPWRIVEQKGFATRSQAVKEERFLKSGIGRKLNA